LVRYALTEGYGIIYERIIREWFFDRIIRHLSIRTVLEVPADGSSGFPGINSSYFVQQGCQVVTVNADVEILRKSGELWKVMGLQVNRVRAATYHRLPFRDGEFDLVWNYCEIEKSAAPKRLLNEMVRVSRKFILLMIQNSLTYGYFIHRIHHRYFNIPWDHGNPRLMRLEKIIQLSKECSLKIVEVGLIDATPFPDTWELMVLPLSAKKNMKYGLRELQLERKVPISVKIIYTFEKCLPWILKLIFAHHPYIIACKDKVSLLRARALI